MNIEGRVIAVTGGVNNRVSLDKCEMFDTSTNEW